MNQRPWDCAQPDEWLPRNLRLCWGGSSGGDSGSSGFSGDGGGLSGFSGDGGFSGSFDSGFTGATTGGGDWGSSGSFDASSFNAGGDVNAFTGTAYDASTSGTGAGGGGDWGSFQATSYGGMNAPNPTFVDVAGPNPGVTTGGGDWGSAGTYSAAGTGGGPGGIFSTDSGLGTYSGGGPLGGGGGFYGGDGPGPGPGYGYGGGGGGGVAGGRSGGGGAFSSPSRSSVTDSTPGYIGTASGGRDVTPAAPSYGGGIGKGGASDETGSEEPEGPANAPAPPSDFGKPAAEPDAAAPDADAPSQSQSVAAAAGKGDEGGGGKGGGQSVSTGKGEVDAPSGKSISLSDVSAAVYGPESSPDAIADAGQRAAETTDYKSAADIIAGDLYGDRSPVDYQGSPYAEMGPNAYAGAFGGPDVMGGARSQQGPYNESPTLPADQPLGTFPTDAQMAAAAAIAAPFAYGPAVGASILGHLGVGALYNARDSLPTFPNISLNPNNWVDINSPIGMPWGQGTAFDQQALGEQGRAGQQMDLASQLGIENIAPTQSIDPGSEQYGTQDYAPGGIEPGAEQTGVETGINPGAEQYGIEPAAPAIEAAIPGDRDATSFEGEQGQITSFIPGSREATNWDYQPATDVTSPPATDAAITAAQDAAARGGDPVDQANAARTAALDAGATQQQADAIAGAVYTAAANQGNLAGPDVMAGGRAGTQFTAETPGGQVGISMTPGSRSAPNLPTINLPSVAAAQPGTVSAPQGIEPGAEQYGVPAPQGIEPGAEQYGVQTGGIEPGAEQYGVETGINPGAEQYGVQTLQGLNPGAEQYGINFQPQSPPPPGLLQMAPPSWVPGQQTAGTITAPPGWMPSGAPPAAPPASVPGRPGGQQPEAQPPGDQQEHDGDREDAGRTPADPNAAPPSRPSGQGGVITQSQRTSGAIRSQAVTDEVSRYLTGAGRLVGVDVNVTSGGQPATGRRGVDRTGSHRHDHGGAADLQLRDSQTGRLLDMRDPQDRARMQQFVTEAIRLGATGVGAGMGYMGPHTIHVGGGNAAHWGGAQWISDAFRDGMRARGRGEAAPQAQRGVPTPRPGPLPREGAVEPPPQEAQQPTPRPPADIPPPVEQPANLPPTAPVDIPETRTTAPLPAARTERAAIQFAQFLADMLAKSGKTPTNREEGQQALNGLAREMAKAGYPASVAQKTILETATQGSIKAGYGPDSNYNALGHVTRAINEMVGTAMQGYRAGKAPETQGPPAPVFAPGRQGALDQPFRVAGADRGDTGRTPTIEDYGREGDVGARQAIPPWEAPTLPQLSPMIAPPTRGPMPQGPEMQPLGGVQLAAGGRDVGAPPAVEAPAPRGRAEWEAPAPGGLGANTDPYGSLSPVDPRSETVFDPQNEGRNNPWIDPDINQLQRQEQQQYQQDLDPRGWREASLLGMLAQFNPISTAEARGRGSRGAEVRAEPTHDASAVAGRLTDARANIVDDLRTNQGLLNLFDLIATMEVGSQGKAAVLAFVEMQMNRAAAEARAEGRQATGKDLARLLNDRTNYAESWGKIDAGKGKTGALTGDIFADAAEGSNTSKGSTGNASARVGFGGNPANAKIGNERFGTENYASHNAWYQSLYGPPMRAEIIGGPEASPASVFTAMPQAEPVEARAEGGPVKKGKPYLVGEEGPEIIVPDESGTVLAHMPQPGRGDPKIGRWPKVTAPDYPGRYRGLEGGIKEATRNAQDPAPTLMDMVDSGQLRLNANWQRMLNDPALIALGQSRMRDITQPGDYEAPEVPAIDRSPNELSRQLGYDAVRRPSRRVTIGNKSY